MPDANKEHTISQLVGAAFGAAGQRCMALSTAIFVGKTKEWIPEIIEKAQQLKVIYVARFLWYYSVRTRLRGVQWSAGLCVGRSLCSTLTSHSSTTIYSTVRQSKRVELLICFQYVTGRKKTTYHTWQMK